MEPTRQAVCEMARELGYQVAVFKPEFADPAGVDDYVRGARRTFLCAKHRDLSQLRVPVEPVERLT
jgi:hypothetical protein